jgi:acetyl-CoA carboxylase biotin carboxylase subunit
MPAIMAAAEITGAQAIHPGYGFLSENANFVQIVEAHGLTFIGPTADTIRMMGDKITAKQAAVDAGHSCRAGLGRRVSPIWMKRARPSPLNIGFPVHDQGRLWRRRSGDESRLAKTSSKARCSTASSEAKAAFGDGAVYIEKYLGQAAAYRDAGHRRQWQCGASGRARLFAAAPSPESARGSALRRPSTRRDARQDRQDRDANAVKAMGYEGAGTIEFLYENGEFYFIEMNTRLQVEHPVTEAITRIDLVREQIRVAAGHELSFTQDDIKLERLVHRVPHQCGEPGNLYALPGHGDRVPRTGRSGRAAR